MLYYLSLFLGAVSGLAALLPMLAAYHLWGLRAGKTSSERPSAPHIASTYIFCFFIALILSVTSVPGIFGLSFDADINLVPFDFFFLGYVEYAQNVVLFVPVGFFLPLLWKRFSNLGLTFAWGFLFSLSIEIMQLFNDRVTDIDDLLMNAAGAVAGYLVWACAKNILPRISALSMGRAGVWRWEPHFCFAFAWVSMLVFKPFVYSLLSALVFSWVFS
jgi:glycopeptide antibiotics resistance protein